MKRLIPVLLVLVLLTVPAYSEDLSGRVVVDGTVAAVKHVDVTAPYSGTLLPFDWTVGDSVGADDILFTMMTTTVYSPEEGTVAAVYAKEGQDASSAMSRFGCVLTIEPTAAYRIAATNQTAQNKRLNHETHVGETLYFRTTGTNADKGTGRVIAVQDDGSFLVEILSGQFDQRVNLQLYRSSGYDAESKVGSGTVLRRGALPVSSAGRVAEVLVKPGDTVLTGTPLLTMMSPDADPGASPVVAAPGSGVISAVAVSPGQQVWKGQLLARIELTDELEIIAQVDEVDLHRVHVGDRLPVTLDMDEHHVLSGTVTEIGSLGVTRLNAAYFTVRLSIDSGLPLGASAAVYLPQ